MTLSHQEAVRFYDRFGTKQDWQRFYEDRAVSRLIAHGALSSAQSVIEFGCGTGRIAQRLLERELPATAHYLALDASATMASLATRRLEPFAPRAEVLRTGGEIALPAGDGVHDRFLSTYVLDLLAEQDIHTLLREAHRVLAPGGLLLLAGLGHGRGMASRLLERGWNYLYRLQPSWVGGCRPIELARFIADGRWEVRYRTTEVQFGLATEVVVAGRLP